MVTMRAACWLLTTSSLWSHRTQDSHVRSQSFIIISSLMSKVVKNGAEGLLNFMGHAGGDPLYQHLSMHLFAYQGLAWGISWGKNDNGGHTNPKCLF